MSAPVALGTTIVLWAAGFAAIRASVPHYAPMALTAARLLVAALAFVALLPIFRFVIPDPAHLRRLLLAAVLGMSGYQLLLNAGQVRVTAATASVIIGTAPLMTALMGWAVLGEKLTTRQVVGAVTAFTGVAVAAAGEAGGIQLEPASVLVLAAAVLQAGYFIVMKPVLVRYRPIEATAWATWLAALTALPLAATLPRPLMSAPTQAHLAVLLLGLGTSAVGYFTWSVALRHLAASVAAVYLYLVPPTAAVVAWLWLGELPTPVAAVGGVATLVGVGVAQTGRRALGSTSPARTGTSNHGGPGNRDSGTGGR